MRALITGISGFVGGYLAQHLLECGDEVLGCSPDGAWTEFSLDGVRPRVEVTVWDLARDDGLSEAALRRLAEFQPQVVYHLAAISVPHLCGGEQPTPLAFEVNVGGTRRVLQWAATVPTAPRVLLVSSSHVYVPVQAPSSRVSEEAPLGPVQAYGRTKLAAEEEGRRALGAGVCDVVIARAFQHTGPGQGPQMMLPEWARQFARGGADPIRIKTRDAYLDLSDVRDVVRAYRLLLERALRGGVYNVGSGIPRRSGDILEILSRLADPGRGVVELQPGTRHGPIADVTRLVQATGWSARIPLEQTVAETLAWWQNRESAPGG